MFSEEIKRELGLELIDYITDYGIVDRYLFDITFDFNQDFYIIGTYKSKEWLKKYFYDMIESVRYFNERYDDNYGKYITNPEKMTTIVAVAVVEEILTDICYELDELELGHNLVEEEDEKLILQILKTKYLRG